MNKRKLTVKQKKFCDYYISSGNATESAIKAGYSKRTAKETGYENLTKPHIQEAIQTHTIKDEEHRMLKAEERQKWLSDVLDGKIKEKRTIKLENGEMAVIEEEPSLDTIYKAHELLNKMQGQYLQRVDIQGEIKTDKMNDILEQLKE